MDSLKGTLTPMKVLQGTLNGGIAYGTFNYNELENKPSVNGTELVGNVNIPIPTKTSDLTNDSGFITDADVPTKTSDLTNDSGFITSADIPTKTSELTNDSGFITEEDIPEIPTNTSQLNNDSGFLTMNTTPVRSVNSQTGDVNLFIPNATSQLNNDAGFVRLQDLSADNIPYDSENSITEKIETIPTYASQMPLSPTDDTTVEEAIGDLSQLTTTDKSSLVEAVNEVVTKLGTKAVIKTKTETLTANQFGTITPSVTKSKILQIMATNATGNVIILPIYNSEYKVYSISGNGTITPFSGSIGVYYSYFE